MAAIIRGKNAGPSINRLNSLPLRQGKIAPLMSAPGAQWGANLNRVLQGWQTSIQTDGNQLTYGSKRQPSCSPSQTAMLVCPKPLAVTRLCSASSIRLLGTYCFT